MALLLAWAVFAFFAWLFKLEARERRADIERRYPSTPYSQYPTADDMRRQNAELQAELEHNRQLMKEQEAYNKIISR